MKLSIIVPVYNMAAENKLEYCMNSLLKQTVEEYEIIAVDDASTDDSLEVLKKYETCYPDKVRVLALHENHKQGGAKNAGLDICRGEYIGFVDSDDWVKPDMYEKLISAAQENNAEIAACNLTRVYEHTMEVADNVASMDADIQGELTAEKRKRLILHSGALVCRVYKRELFQNPVLRFPEHMFYEDNAIGTELLFRAKRIVYLNEPMYFYLQNPQSTVHTITQKRCEDRMRAMKIMVEMSKQNGYFEPYHEELEYKFVNLFYQNTLFSYMQGIKDVKFAFLRKLATEMRNYFPDFARNKYYLENINGEERFLMELLQKSALMFVGYYKALWLYRRIRYRRSIP